MSHRILYVTREATVRTAIELVRVHHADVIPVLDDGKVVGLLDALQLTLYDGETSVAEACLDALVTVETATHLPEAARLMRRHGVRQAPVLQDGRLVGTLGVRDLLRVWGVVNDSLTGLPVQHQLRDWISRHLGTGTEVVVLFLDLDEFGRFNKQHGHVVGDHVLQRVADALRETVDPETDFASRFGGDEFAIATTRPLGGARELAVQVRDRISALTIDNLAESIGVSIGIAGGRRAHARTDIHPDATLDDLITRASTASTAAKKTPERIQSYESAMAGQEEAYPLPRLTQGERSDASRVVVEGYKIGETADASQVTVALRSADRRHEASVAVVKGDFNQALANATALCMRPFMRSPGVIEVEDTYEYATPGGVLCVGATVRLRRPDGGSERLVGSSPISDDIRRSYINVVLDATNRRAAQV